MTAFATTLQAMCPRVPAIEEQAPKINHIGFNQDQTRLCVADNQGFAIFSMTSKTGVSLLHHVVCGPVSLAEMFFETPLVAVVGGSPQESSPSATSKTLTMWSAHDRRALRQAHFDWTIKAVRMSHRRVVVMLKRSIHILDAQTLRSLRVLDRVPSSFVDPSLSSMCNSGSGLLAVPLYQQLPTGGAEPCDAELKLGVVGFIDTHDLCSAQSIVAHRSPLQALCLNATGQWVATASEKASVVRIFSVSDLSLLFSFRRGTSQCRIFSLLFSCDSAHLCVSSSTGVVHLFKTSDESRALPSCSTAASSAQLEAAHCHGMSSSAYSSPVKSSSPASICGSPLSTYEQPVSVDADDEAYDMSDWNIIAERPDRLLELSVGSPSYEADSCAEFMSPRRGRRALEVLSMVSELAVQGTHRHVGMMLQFLPQSCRELMDAQLAFAWVHAAANETGGKSGEALGHPSSDLSSISVSGGVVACVLPSACGADISVLAVGTRCGVASVYCCDAAAGGKGRLRAEHCLVECRSNAPGSRRCI